MLVKDMFTKEFYDKYGDIDVYDDVCEELGIAFCGALLTDEGKEHFAMVLYDEAEINDGVAVVLLDCMAEGKWQKHLRMLEELFEGVAGYCAEDDWNKWFKFLDAEDEDGEPFEVFPFTDDKDKMYDFLRLTKDEFLQSYSYLTEAEYNATLTAVLTKLEGTK